MLRVAHSIAVVVVLLACGVVFSTGAWAQKIAPFDQLFLRSEARGSATELAIARLAETRAERAAVKAYASTLVHDHEAYDAALRDLAAERGVSLPAGVTAQGKAVVDRLARLHGRAFDRAFIAEAVRINAADMRAFRAEAARTADADIGGFVAKFLPVEEQHEQAARALTQVSVARTNRMPIIPPPATGSRMPVITPPDTGSKTPVIPPPVH